MFIYTYVATELAPGCCCCCVELCGVGWGLTGCCGLPGTYWPINDPSSVNWPKQEYRMFNHLLFWVSAEVLYQYVYPFYRFYWNWRKFFFGEEYWTSHWVKLQKKSKRKIRGKLKNSLFIISLKRLTLQLKNYYFLDNNKFATNSVCFYIKSVKFVIF